MPTYELDGKRFQSDSELTSDELSQLSGGSPTVSENKTQDINIPSPTRLLLKDNPTSLLDKASNFSASAINNFADVGDATRNILSQVQQHPFQSVGNTIGGTVEALLHPIDTVKAIGSDLVSKVKNAPNKPIDALLTGASLGLGAEVAPGVVGGVVRSTSNLGKLLKYDSNIVQAQKAKVALDTMRSTLGKAKEIALSDVKDIPANIDNINIPDKLLSSIKNPIYKVEFNDSGNIVPTVGNLDKVKLAIGDRLSSKDFVEASKIEKRQIKQIAGQVRDTMLQATNNAGKPELGQALDAYSSFMNKYNLVNKTIVDSQGNAMGNRLKKTFEIMAEPAYKNAWKELSNSNPELKSIMSSMKNRENVRNVLKLIGVVELGKKTITGSF